MLNTLVVLVLYFLVPTHQQFQCPLNENLQPIDGTFPDNVFCNIYYHCINGTAYAQQCPPGLLFTVKLKNCLYSLCVKPNQAKCPGDNPVILKELHSNNLKQKENHLNKQSFTCDPRIDGTFPNPGDCRQYYHCVGGVSWPQQCPADYYFNPKLNIRDCNIKVCVPLSDANCPINGEWSQWSEFTECFPTCGNGLKVRFRECNNPPPSNGGRECAGNSVDALECDQTDCLTPTSAEPTFFVANRRGRIVDTVHPYDNILINNENLFDSGSSYINVTESGFYFTSFGITNSGSYFGYASSGAGTTTEYSKLHSRTGMQGHSYIALRKWEKNSIINRAVVTRSHVHGTEDGRDTYWLSFRYVSDHVLFLGRRTLVNTPGLIDFTETITKQGITGTDSIFEINEDGLYFVTINFALRGQSIFWLEKNNNRVPEMSFNFTASSPFRKDATSKSAIIHFSRGDKFNFRLESGRLESNVFLPLSVVALRLNGTDGSPLISLERRTSFNSANQLSRFTFDNVQHDIGNSWNSNRNEFICKVPGIYIVSIATGIGQAQQGYLEVHVNGRIEGRIISLLNNDRYTGLISRSLLVTLSENDVISIEGRGIIELDSSTTVCAIFYVSSTVLN